VCDQLQQLNADPKLSPSATDMVQSFLELAVGSQSKREGLLVSLAAKVARKANCKWMMHAYAFVCICCMCCLHGMVHIAAASFITSAFCALRIHT
jgi:hypothetical protein